MTFAARQAFALVRSFLVVLRCFIYLLVGGQCSLACGAQKSRGALVLHPTYTQVEFALLGGRRC
jgi:hypothetical protein